jgi:hypothetical protein
MFNYHFLAVRHGLPRIEGHTPVLNMLDTRPSDVPHVTLDACGFLGLSFLNGLVTRRLCRRERWAKLGPWAPVAGVLPLLLRLLLGSRAHPGRLPTCGLAGGLLGAGHPLSFLLFMLHHLLGPGTFLKQEVISVRSVQRFLRP